MNHLTRALSALLLISGAALASAQVADFKQGEVLVKFRSQSRAGLIENLAIRAKKVGTISRLDVQQLKLPSGMSTMDAVNYYRGLSSVEYAEPNYIKHLTYIPNDPRYTGNQQWGQKKIDCEGAWGITKGKGTVIVAVIDTGIDLNHEDLKNKLVPGYDFSDNDSDPTFDGDHGVHCAGIVGADTDNGKGVGGTGFNCKIMPLKIFPNATASASANAMIYAADHGAKVISMSYISYGESITEKNAVNYAWNKGLVLLAGAGNDNTDTLGYPNAYPNVISVGSTNTSDQKSGFSNWGADHVDVAAPGEDIMSTLPGGYGNATGTSMACPMAAGVVGLLWSVAAPGTTNTEIREALESTCDPVVGANNFVAFGRVNAFKAVKKLDASAVVIPSPPTSIDPWMGNDPSGGVNDVQVSDGNTYLIRSQSDALGQVAGIEVNLAYGGTVTSGLRSAELIVEANAVSGASNQVFFWNYNTNRYQLMKSLALRPTGANRQVAKLTTNLTPFVSGGALKVAFRAILPKRSLRGLAPSAFDFTINYIQLETRENSN